MDTADPETITQVRSILADFTTSLSPYPDPHVLADYDAYRAGFADRVVERIDRETEHRRAIELRDERRKDRGQVFGLATALAGLGFATVVAIQSGSYIVASVMAIVAVGGPSAATVLARYLDRNRER